MSIPLENPNILSLAAGFTDNNTLPAQMIQEVVAGMPQKNPNNEYLQYGTTQGRAPLRELTCEYLNGLKPEKEDAFSYELTTITNGSQQALFLATLTLCNPGDYVLVESPTYFVYLSMLQSMQIKPIGIPVDKDNIIDPKALSSLLDDLSANGELEKVRAAYLIGYYANPSSRCLKLQEKKDFAATLSRHNLFIPIIEDAAYRDLSYGEMDPTPSIMSLQEFDAFPKLYLGTYTKPFATGLKIGYGTCSSTEWHGKMLCAKGNQDFGTSNFSQAIIERILLDQHYQPLLKELGEHYRKKADLLDQVLTSSEIRGKGWKWEKPSGGLLFWLRAPDSMDTAMGEAFSEACKEKGVIYVPGNFCFASGSPKNFIRLSIGALCDEKLIEAATRFCEVALKF